MNRLTYVQPDDWASACALYHEFEHPLFYGGGSEIITMRRAYAIDPDALIDLKHIPETREMRLADGWLTIGGCVTLREISDSKLFPLLGSICGRIADHTNQCRITLGGNLCGTIIYRETAQALLLTDAQVDIAGRGGVRSASIYDVFHGRMALEPGEFVLRLRIPAHYLALPYSHVKKTASEKIDYPLVSMSAVLAGDKMRAAFSGVFDHPFRSGEMERILNDRNLSRDQRLESVMDNLPKPVLADYQAGSPFRAFVLKQTLSAALEVFDL